jgi:hypothetical protein
MFHAYPLPRERVYGAVAQKLLWYISLSSGRCIVTALHATLLPPSGYSSRMAYRRTAISSFPRAVLATSVLGLIFLPVARFSRCLLSNPFRCSLLKTDSPERLPDKVRAGPSLSPSSFFLSVRAKVPRVVDAPIFMVLMLLLVVSFFRFGGGRPLHDVLTFIFRDSSLHDLQHKSLPEDPAGCPFAS